MKILTILLGLTVILFSQNAFTQVSVDELLALREQIQVLTQRLDELEKANRQTKQSVEQVHDTAAAQVNEDFKERIDQAVSMQFDERMEAVSWAERMRWSGDFRSRYEEIKVEKTYSRNRTRIRARAHL